MHHILKFRKQRFRIYKIKEYFIISCYLNSNITFDEEKRSFVLQWMILNPFHLTCFFFVNLFEENYFLRRLSDECLVEDEEHVT